MTVSELTGPCYLDSSALARVYLPETGSDLVNEALTGRDDLLISDLVVTEILSAVTRRRRQESLTIQAAQSLHKEILKDIESGILTKVDLTPRVFRQAEQLLLSLDTLLRALDAIHLSLALMAGAKSVLTFDERMKEAAVLVGKRECRLLIETAMRPSHS